MLVSFSN